MIGQIVDARGRIHLRATDAQLAELERDDERQRLRDQLAALRVELDGLPTRNWLVQRRNAQRPNGSLQPLECETPPSEIEAEIARVQAQLDELGG